MNNSLHLPFIIYRLSDVSQSSFYIDKTNAKHFPSLIIDHCKLIIGMTGGKV